MPSQSLSMDLKNQWKGQGDWKSNELTSKSCQTHILTIIIATVTILLLVKLLSISDVPSTLHGVSHLFHTNNLVR